MKFITHYQVDITFSSDITQGELDTALSKIKIDGMREHRRYKQDLYLKESLEMTDNEILKALEELSERGMTFCNVGMSEFARNILGLINRQKAEIERLNSCVKSEDEIRAIMKDQMTPMVREIVNEQIDTAIKLARKEFAEKLDELFEPHKTDSAIIWVRVIMNRLLKEMESEI